MSQTIYRSVNPMNQKLLKTFDYIKPELLDNRLAMAQKKHKQLRSQQDGGMKERKEKFSKLKEVLAKNSEHYATTMTEEMGKCITQSRMEV